MNNALWDQLCTLGALKRGWHLTRADTQHDFIGEPFARETFAYFLEENLGELLRILKLGDYQPTPLTRVSIPKGALATRPGTLLAIEDRVVLFAALQLIAPPIDSQLIDGVYSYRVKQGSKKALFHEGDALSLPFLKKSTVQKYIDPFDRWYALWPKFNEISREAFEKESYAFMATSDIAAYFENIQIDILREQLVDLLPGEQRIINLFMSSFALWTYDTAHGRRYLRGVPQGTQISSFFGNVFLKPIDDAFTEFGKEKDIRYFRYVDDIRIFAKERSVAREAILLLDNQIRTLHLNLQTAKTQLFEERYGEISSALIDKRFAQIDRIKEILVSNKKEKKPPDLEHVHRLVERVLDEKPSGGAQEQRIRYAKSPLSGLSDRVFRSLLTLDLSLESHKLLDRLLSEIAKNADYRLGLKLIQYARRFPRKAKIQTKLMNLLRSGQSVFPFQEAQILKAIRYQSRVEALTRAYCLERAVDDEVDAQIRIEALHLVARCALDDQTIEVAARIFRGADSTAVKKAATLILVRQRGVANVEFIRRIVFHPHDGLRKLGKLYRVVKNDDSIAQRIAEQAFKEGFLMIEYLPLLYLMIESRESRIVQRLLGWIKNTKANKSHSHMDMRDRAQELLHYGDQNLRARAG